MVGSCDERPGRICVHAAPQAREASGSLLLGDIPVKLSWIEDLQWRLSEGNGSLMACVIPAAASLRIPCT
jgi:hypothetical protein